MKRHLTLLALATLSFASPLHAETTVEETTLGAWTIPDTLPIAVSADGCHLLGMTEKNGKCTLNFDGKEVGAFDHIEVPNAEAPRVEPIAARLQPPLGKFTYPFLDSPAISNDGKHYAFLIRRGDKMSAVYDGKIGPPADGIIRPAFSADARHFLYTAYLTKSQCALVVDGKAGATYTSVTSVIESPDSKRFAFIAENAPMGIRANSKYFAVCDGRPGPAFDSVGHMRFSPDSRRLFYVAQRGTRSANVPSALVADGNVIAECSARTSIYCSPDSKRLAYEKMLPSSDPKTTRSALVVDGKEGPAFDSIDAVAFSPDSKQIAYIGKRKNETLFVLDGKETPIENPHISPVIVFSPDSRRIAYYAGKTIVVDGKPLDVDGEAFHPTFSPDSSRFAFISESAGKRAVVVDGAPSMKFRDWSLRQTPDAAHLAAAFSPDSRHWAGWGCKGAWGPGGPRAMRWELIVDGKSRAEYEVPGNTAAPWLTFNKDNTLEFFALKEGKFLHVKVTP